MKFAPIGFNADSYTVCEFFAAQAKLEIRNFKKVIHIPIGRRKIIKTRGLVEEIRQIVDSELMHIFNPGS
jgi:hypothetical protein